MPKSQRLSKQIAGAIGEQIAIAYLQSLGNADAKLMNTEQNNYPVDATEDHKALEIKTGQVWVTPGAQQWRLTIGEPGEEEKAWLAKATDEQKAAWNKEKQKRIHERKEKAKKQIETDLGHQITLGTITMLLDPVQKVVDLYQFDGVHDRIGWNSEMAKGGYKGSFRYEH